MNSTVTNAIQEVTKLTFASAKSVDEHPKRVEAAAVTLIGGLQVLACLLGKQPEGVEDDDAAARLNPVATLYAALLLTKMVPENPTKVGEKMLRIEVECNHEAFYNALLDLEKLIGEPADAYLHTGMLRGVREFQAFKEKGIEGVSPKIKQMLQAEGILAKLAGQRLQ